MIIDELLIALGFEYDDDSKKAIDDVKKDIDKLLKNLKSLAKDLIKIAAGFVASASAMVFFVKAVSQINDELGKSAEAIGINVEELDAWIFAANIVTGSGDQMASSMKNLNKIIGETSRGIGTGVTAFSMLGIDVRGANGELKDASKVLMEVLSSVGDLESSAERADFLDKLGLSNMKQLAELGAEGIRKLKEEAFELSIVTKEDAKRAAEFNDAWFRMSRVIKGVFNLISGALSPALTELVDEFTAWVKKNKEFLKQDLNKTFKLIAQSFKTLIKFSLRLFDIFTKFTSLIGGFSTVLKIATALLAAFVAVKLSLFMLVAIKLFGALITLIKVMGTQALIAQGKLLLIPIVVTAIIAALALFIEDIITFVNGGDSLFGMILDKFPLVKAVLEGLQAQFVFLFDLLFALRALIEDPFSGEAWGTFFDTIKGSFGDLFKGITKGFVSAVDRIMQPIRSILSAFDIEIPSIADSLEKLGVFEVQGAIKSPGIIKDNLSTLAQGNVSGISQGFNSTVNNSRVARVEADIKISGDATGLNTQELQEAVSKRLEGDMLIAMQNLERGESG